MSKNTNLSFLTDYITADITNGRIGINNASPTVAFDVSGATKISGTLTLTSTISNGTYTYTLPSATGTLALTSAISGTTNYVPKFTASGTIGNSLIYDNGTNVGIGTISPTTYIDGSTGLAINGSARGVLSLIGTSSTADEVLGRLLFTNTNTTNVASRLVIIDGVRGADNNSGYLTFSTSNSGAPTERMRITSGGNVQIKNSTADTSIEIFYSGTTSTGAMLGDANNFVIGGQTGKGLTFCTNNLGQEKMRITVGGNVMIGTSTDGGYKFEVNGGSSAVATRCISSGSTTAGSLWDGGGAPSFHAWSRPDDCGIGSNSFAGKSILIKTGMSYGSFTTGTTRIEIQSSGAVVIPGSLSKGSGSFRIDHPLKPDTHQLVHSFIEGPQADLIYRGKLTLVNGKAQANIDEVSTMTEGTFEALCREVQCFTTNENGWDLVKGKVIGNIIYIESQNPNSTDEISWMVIGERKDKHMMDTEWTDEQGKVIVEPLKQK